MRAQSSRIDVKQASEIAKCSTRQIQKIIKDGTLAAYRDKSNKYLIETSEFYRVFPGLMPRTAANTRELVREQDNTQLLFLKEQNEFLKGQLEHANNEKRSLLSALDNAQRLIELSPKKRKRLFGFF